MLRQKWSTMKCGYIPSPLPSMLCPCRVFITWFALKFKSYPKGINFRGNLFSRIFFQKFCGKKQNLFSRIRWWREFHGNLFSRIKFFSYKKKRKQEIGCVPFFLFLTRNLSNDTNNTVNTEAKTIFCFSLYLAKAFKCSDFFKFWIFRGNLFSRISIFGNFAEMTKNLENKFRLRYSID